jgi:LPXTG-site transpeptidase (sortase) family protein
MVSGMRRNLIAGLLVVVGVALMATALQGLVLHIGVASVSSLAVETALPQDRELGPKHQHARFLAGIHSTGAGPSQVIGTISIPRLGIKNAPIFDRGLDARGNMIIAKGISITHFSLSEEIGFGNAVLYGHDDIEGNVFQHLEDLRPGDEVKVAAIDDSSVTYRVIDRKIVPPDAVHILAPTGDVRLTMFTCWPTWVDTQRIVVTATPVR